MKDDENVNIEQMVSSFEAYFFIMLCPLVCGLVVRVPDCWPRGPGSIPGATRFSE
jgi:hypothetical protein